MATTGDAPRTDPACALYPDDDLVRAFAEGERPTDVAVEPRVRADIRA